MSSALAIAGVTQILRDLLNEGVIDGDVSAVIGASVAVRALPPDRLQTVASPDGPLINLFLHQVTRNPGWANAGLPARAPDGRRVSSPPLALDLHYLLSAYGFDELHGEILLGYALQILDEHPVLGRGAIRTALAPAVPIGGGLPPALQALGETGLADQIEQLKISPEPLDTEAMSRIWTALQTNYRPSAGFVVTVVLVDRPQPARAALPVLRVGPDARGARVAPDVLPPLPEIAGIELPARQTSARLGETITVSGRNLDGTGLAAVFRNARLTAPLSLAPAAPPAPTARAVRIDIPNDAAAAADWIAGPLTVEIALVRPGESAPRRTNALPLLLAPRADFAGAAVTRTGDVVEVSVDVVPEVRAGQVASMTAGDREAPAESFAGPAAGTLTFRFADLPAGTYPARLRVDGVDSWLLLRERPPLPPDFAPRPPAFDPTQEITAPA